jgi:hypothetical protein
MLAVARSHRSQFVVHSADQITGDLLRGRSKLLSESKRKAVRWRSKLASYSYDGLVGALWC